MSTTPQPYERAANFISYEASYPSRPKRGADLDAEFNAVQLTLNSTLSRLNEIQRDDGLLTNSIVGPQALTAEALVLLGNPYIPRGSWLSATVYSPADLVEHEGLNYLAIVQHLSDDFDIDLAEGRWQAFGGYPTAAQVVFAPAGSVGSVSVQDAITELDGDVQGKQPASINLSALAALSPAADRLPYWTSDATMAATTLTGFARTLLAGADAAAARTTLGVIIGAAAGNVLQLDGSAKIPAVDGSQLTGVVPADASVTDAKLAATLNLSAKTITLPPANTPAFVKEYVSAEQTITSAGLLTLAHGLGARPKIFQLTLVCKTAEANYAIGDEIVVTVNQTAAAADRHTSVRFDATNIYVRYSNTGAVFFAANATTGAGVGLTNTNWRLVVKAWA